MYENPSSLLKVNRRMFNFLLIYLYSLVSYKRPPCIFFLGDSSHPPPPAPWSSLPLCRTACPTSQLTKISPKKQPPASEIPEKVEDFGERVSMSGSETMWGPINLSETSASTSKRQNLVNFTAATATLTPSNDV